jgi:hypothetical protein
MICARRTASLSVRSSSRQTASPSRPDMQISISLIGSPPSIPETEGLRRARDRTLGPWRAPAGRSGLEGTFGPIGVSAKNKRCRWAWWVPFLLDWFWGAAAAAPLPRGERGVASCKPLRGEPKRNVVFALFGETASVVLGGSGLWRARAAPLAGAADAAEKGEPPAGGVSPRVCARARSATHAGRPLVVIQSVFNRESGRGAGHAGVDNRWQF